jgi:hypothetical protein
MARSSGLAWKRPSGSLANQVSMRPGLTLRASPALKIASRARSIMRGSMSTPVIETFVVGTVCLHTAASVNASAP